MADGTGEARIGSLIPQEHRVGMRTFCLRQSVFPIASGLVFTDGRVMVVHRSGREELHPDIDSVMRDYVGTAGLLWDKRGEAAHEGAPRLFVFRRFADSHGVSGRGVAMEGGQWPDGRVVLTWLGPYSSLVHWPDIEQAVTIHGHAGETALAWLDELGRAA
jgi:hypothetical protein